MVFYSFYFAKTWLTGNHPLESRGKHFKNIREKSILLYETKTYKEDLYEKFVFKT